MVNSVLNTGVAGLNAGIGIADRAASDMTRATSGDETVEITQAAVDLKLAEHQVKASAQVIKTADEVLGTLIDTRA